MDYVRPVSERLDYKHCDHYFVYYYKTCCAVLSSSNIALAISPKMNLKYCFFCICDLSLFMWHQYHF